MDSTASRDPRVPKIGSCRADTPVRCLELVPGEGRPSRNRVAANRAPERAGQVSLQPYGSIRALSGPAQVKFGRAALVISNDCDAPGHPPLRISSLLGRREPTRLSNQPHTACKCLAVNSFSSYTARMDSGVEPQTSKRYKTQADGVWNWLEEQWVTLLVAVAFIFYAARLFRLISRYAVNIFFSDQWEFNDATLFQKHSLWQIFDWQHGPHRQGLGALFEKLVDPIFGWNSRIESFIVWGVIVTAAICALWLKRRLYGSFSVFDVVIPAILFIPAQWETLFVTANFSHGPFPLLLILVYCLSWTFGKRAVRYPLVLLINFVSIYTGFGIFLGVLTPILLALDYWASAPQTR